MKKFLDFLYKAFSEKGVPSSKRVIGGILGVDLAFCITYIVMTNKCDDIVAGVVKFGLAMVATLFGISAAALFAKKGGKK